jgi:hypothetical protein
MTWRELIVIERTLWSLVRHLFFKTIGLSAEFPAVAYVWLSGSRNDASWVQYVVGERCLDVNRQADVFLPGPGSASTIVVWAPKWAVYALRVDFRGFK